mgnify:CR=1 FL=1
MWRDLVIRAITGLAGSGPGRSFHRHQQQVDHLIDTRPGKELLTAVYDDPAHPVVDGLVYRSGGNTACRR